MIGGVEAWVGKMREMLLAKGFVASIIAELETDLIEGFTKKSSKLDAPVVYVSSGVHGDEPAGPLALEALVSEGFFSEDYTWLVCPMLNPTGHRAGSRENAQGVDLNRDYYYKESREARGHVDWINGQALPDIMLSLHEDWESTGYYFYEINIRKDAPERAHALMQRLDVVMPRERELLIDDHEVRECGWIYHEAIPDEFECWPEAIFMANSRRCPISLTMETPSSQDLDLRVATQVEFVKAAVEIWCSR